MDNLDNKEETMEEIEKEIEEKTEKKGRENTQKTHENGEKTPENKEKKCEKKQKTARFAPYFAVLCLLIVGLAAFTCLTAFKAGGENKQLSDKVNELTERFGRFSENVNRSLGIYDPENESEDGVVIAGQFKIESTLPISDAYKSGDASALTDRQKETLDMASKVLDSIITDGMSDYEKEFAVYNWLTTRMENETGHLTVISTAADDSGNPYGVLKYRKAVCAGYATTFRLFMQMMDIDCKVVHSNERGHSWDLVNLDGDWYHVDCYMDSGSGNCRNCNMDDSSCGMGHDWPREFFPKANGEKYSYVMMNSVELESFYDIPAWVKSLIDEGKPVGACWFTNGIKPEEEAEAALLVNTLVEALNSSSVYNGELFFESQWSESDDRGYVFTIYIQNSGNEEPDDDLPPEVYEKINSMIADAFGEDIYISEYYYGDYEDGYAYDTAGSVSYGV